MCLSRKKVELGTFPTVDKMLRTNMQLGVRVYACEVSEQALGWGKVDLVEGTRVLGAHTMNCLALDTNATTIQY